jgi:SAM-dependent methyltransferase
MTDGIDRNAFRDFERARHHRLADTYHEHFVPVSEHAAEPLLDAAKVRAGMRVLDVACGSGVVAGHAARRGAVVTGVDLAPRMLELAAELNPGCTFREASVDAMPFEDGAFDAVVCGFGIGHFPDAPAAVAECARVARAGARCAFAWWDVPERNRMHGVMIAAIDEAKPAPAPDVPAGPPLFRYCDDAEFRGLLESAGLREVSVAPHQFFWRLPDAAALWEACMGCMARTSAVIDAQTPEVRERIRAAFARRAGEYATARGLELPMAFKVCVGRKPG